MHTISSTGVTPQQMKLWVDLFNSRTVFKLPDGRAAGVRWRVKAVDPVNGSILLYESVEVIPLTVVTFDPPIPILSSRPSRTFRAAPLPPPCRQVGVSRRTRQFIWGLMIAVCVMGALALSSKVQAIELQKCEWLADEAYSQTWLRDAGVTFTQIRIQIRQGDAPPEVKQGQIALSRYVYAHTEKSPDDMADDMLQDCRGYNQ